VTFPYVVVAPARRRIAAFAFAILAALLLHTSTAFAGTTTALAVTAASSPVTTVASGTVVTLTATVSGLSQSRGVVEFCNATALHCTDVNLLGTAQITTANTASMRFIPGRGTHSYKAVFIGTKNDGGSTSATAGLTVTPLPTASIPYATTTTITPSGTTGNYTLTATVTGTGSAITPITGSVTFPDAYNSNISLGSATLGANTPGTIFNVTDYQEYCPYNSGMVVADFNNDGIPDVATSCGQGNKIAVYIGTGNGVLAAPVYYAVDNVGDNGNAWMTLAVADLNSDGIPDLIYVNQDNNEIIVLMGKGDGTFQPQAITKVGNRPISIAVGDFNNDGIPDVAVASTNTSAVSVLLGNGDGTFTVQTATYPTGTTPSEMITADFNNDGNLDLAVTDQGSKSVTILLGKGDGTFTTGATLTTGNSPGSLVAADFNRDGNLDLAVSNQSDNTVSVFLGTGTGLFTTAATPVGQLDSPKSIVAGDLNGDGIPDLIVVNNGYANSATNDSSIFMGNGDGTFNFSGYASINNNSLPAYGDQDNPNIAVIADMNGDGRPDILMIDDNINFALTVDLNTGGTMSATAVLSNVAPAGAGTHNVAASYPGDANYSSSLSGTTQLNGTSSTLTSLAITALPANGAPGTAYAFTVTAYNGGTTIATGYKGTITLVSNDPLATLVGGGTSYTFTAADAGVHTFTSSNGVIFQTPGADTLAVKDTLASVTSSAAGITIRAASVASAITQTAPLPSGTAGIGVPVTYSVTVSNASAGYSGTPSGTVQFYNGSATLGSAVTITSGKATLTTTFNSAQTASITAVYAGDSNFAGTTSSAFAESIVAPGLSISASPTSLTITRGTPATATITFTPTGNYQGTASYACSGLPVYSSCIFTPASLTFTGNNAVQTSTLTLYTLAPSAAPGITRSALLWMPAVLLGLLLLNRRRVGITTRSVLLLLMVCAAAGISGCGKGNFVTPTGNSSITVNVTAVAAPGFSNVSSTATIAVTIQ